MIKQTISMLLLFLVACHSNKEVQPSEKDAVKTHEITVVDSISSDAITGATSKPNAIYFNGIIVVPPQNIATISLTMGGIIKSTSILPGQQVKQGTVLAILENPELIILQQTYLDSHAQTEYLETEYQRQKALSVEQAASQKQLQQSKADYLSMKSRMEGTAAQLKILGIYPETVLQQGIQSSLQIKAPIDGYVSDMQMNVGKYMSAGESMCEIVDKSHILLKLTVYEKDLAVIKTGTIIEFQVNSIEKSIYRAKLISIGQKVDKMTRSVEVFAKVNNVDPFFRPGMYITARIPDEL